MSGYDLGVFNEIWAVDFEFGGAPGEKPAVVCMVAEEWRTRRRLMVWQDELERLPEAPFNWAEDSLVVAYYASAEMGCHLALGWPLPVNVLDLYAEFRNFANGHTPACGWGLLGALKWYGLPGVDAADKESMRQLALRGGPYSCGEAHELLEYCASDVTAVLRLLEAMAPRIDLPRALLRGRYMKAAARIEHQGVPVDADRLTLLKAHWNTIQHELIQEIDRDYGVYDGGSFRTAQFADYLVRQQIPWPRLASGALDLSDDTFRDMARSFPVLAPLRELRSSLSQMRLADLTVGSDGRNRTILSAFRARTGRNQPSNSRSIFGPSVWVRGLIRPEPGRGLAYIDWSQQEFGIAAALSGDGRMQEAYLSGDPYLTFAKQAGAVPSGATKASHAAVREQFKACVLAVQYGMGAKSLGERIGQSEAAARDLLRMHRQTYSVFWDWSDAALDHAMLFGRLWTVFGWTLHVTGEVNPRSVRNFLMQANGAEMLRLACCLVTEAGIGICAPVHDALLIEAPVELLDDAISETQELMAKASEVVLGGFRLRSDAKRIVFPDRYQDPRGARMWDVANSLLDRVSGTPGLEPASARDARERDGTCASLRPRPISSSGEKGEVDDG